MKVKLNHYHLKRFTVFFLQSKHGKLCKLEEVKSEEKSAPHQAEHSKKLIKKGDMKWILQIWH